MRHRRRTQISCPLFFFFQAEDGIRYLIVTGVQTCALPISSSVSATCAFGLALTLLASSCTPSTPAPSGSPRSSGGATHLQLIEAEDAQTLDPDRKSVV